MVMGRPRPRPRQLRGEPGRARMPRAECPPGILGSAAHRGQEGRPGKAIGGGGEWEGERRGRGEDGGSGGHRWV